MGDDIIDVEDDILYAPPDAPGPGSSAMYPDLPKLNGEEKPMIGPTSVDGRIKVHYKSQIDGYEVHPDDMKQMAQMEAMGLPTGFSFGTMQYDAPPQLKTRKQKATYYCNLCKLELNSEDTLKSHMQGQKHMKKQLSQDQANALSIPAVVPIANPAPTRKKQPLRLHEKILQNPQSMVGLRFVKEFIACSNSEMEPHYECGLCETQGMSNCMFQHLVGRDHRQKFVEHLFPNDPNMLSLSQSELLRYAKEHDEKEEDLLSLITTRMSDDEYPWPAGTEPWLVENGGTGIIPDGARKNFGKTKPTAGSTPSPMLSAAAIKRDVKPDPMVLTTKYEIPDPEALKSPKTHYDAMKMFDIGKKLILTGSRANNQINSELGNLLQTTISAMEYALLGSSSPARSPSTSSGRSTSSCSSSAARTVSGKCYRSMTPSTSNSSRDLSYDSDGRGFREDYNYNRKRRKSPEHSQEREYYKRRRSPERSQERHTYKRRRSPEDYSGRRDYSRSRDFGY